MLVSLLAAYGGCEPTGVREQSLKERSAASAPPQPGDGERTPAATRIIDADFVGGHGVFVLSRRGELWSGSGAGEWKRLSLPSAGTVTCIDFLDNLRGWAVTDKGIVLKTADGGAIWEKVGEVKEAGKSDFRLTWASQVKFTDDLNGWLVEALTVWHTEDGGRSWAKRLSVLSPQVNGQPVRGAFLDARAGWVCATNGEVYKTEDGGLSWQTRKVADRDDLTDIYFTDERHGWVAANGGSAPSAGIIYSTADGGSTWRVSRRAEDGVEVGALFFVNSNEGWAAGRQRPGASQAGASSKAVMLHTSDGGMHWELQSIEVPAHRPPGRVYFADEARGWVVSQEKLYSSSDGGRTYNVILDLGNPPR